MTYCVGLKLDSGLLFASDSRTNAGIDNIAQFRKTHVLQKAGERAMVVLTAGNLSLSQWVIEKLERSRSASADQRTIWNVESLFDAAEVVGGLIREVQQQHGSALAAAGVESGASFVLGGQIRGEAPRMFQIYTPGNFIEATHETLYFQLGESKYGRPILDRVVSSATPLPEAVKCVLVSFDSTMRSNVSVGAPIEICWLVRDSLQVHATQKLADDDPYLTLVRQNWATNVRRAFADLPDPVWFNTAL